MQVKLSMQGKYANYLRSLAADYEISFSDVVNELCEWAISDPTGKADFEGYLDEEYPEEEEEEEAEESVASEEEGSEEEDVEEEAESEEETEEAE